MKALMRSVFKFSTILVLAVMLGACSKISQENFDRIKPNMTMKDVVAILGQPNSTESVNIAGISGTSAVWKDERGEISIQFLNDKMTVKSFSKEAASSESSASVGH